ncbi:hypothetical protein Agub_g10463, partial [Astrephomene gubernaculifera]
MEARADNQLMQVHQAIERWQSCKGDLDGQTRALTRAAYLLRCCLDSWPTRHGDTDADARDIPPTAFNAELLALVCQELAQAQYLHALALCAAGQGPAADPWVAGLGYRLRLSDQVWAACAASLTGTPPATATMLPSPSSPSPLPLPAAAASSASAGVSERGRATMQSPPSPSPARLRRPLVYDGALPPPLLQRLAVAFDPAGGSPYWRQHRYGKCRTPFFSYIYRLDQEPSSVVEEAIRRLHMRLLREAETAAAAAEAGIAAEAAEQHLDTDGGGGGGGMGDGGSCGSSKGDAGSGTGSSRFDSDTVSRDCAAAAEGRLGHPHGAALAAALRGAVVAEWWAHSREPGAPHQLHFDVDESVLRL